MNPDNLKEKLIAAARAATPDDRVPYAFEKRIMARIASQPAALDVTALWARGLWRAALPCVAITILMGAFSFLPSRQETSDQDLVSAYEEVMTATADQQEEIW